MTVSTHTLTAVLINSPSNITLDVKGGLISLDSMRSPHVMATLNVNVDSLTTLNLLDPRLDKRIQITATRTNPSQSRTFNLALRRRGIPQADLTISLELASDEILLQDYRALADDDSPIALADSLRDVVDYVLGEAVPGAALAASPSNDADVHPTWEVTNLHTNPEIVNTYGYGIGTGATAPTRVLFGSVAAIRWEATASDSILVPTPAFDSFRVRQGTWYVFTIEVLSQVARTAQLAIQWYAGAGTAPMQTLYGPPQTTSTTVWKTFEIIARAPVGAQSMVPLVVTYGNVAGQYQYVKRVMVYEGDRVVTSFAGGYADDADYQYAWTASPDGSPSIRTPLEVRPDPEALIWRAGQSAMDLLLPLLQANGLRLVCDEARVWTLRNDAYTATGSLSITYATNMIDGEDALDRASDAWCDGAVTEYTWTDRDGISQRVVDSYGTTPSKVRLFTKPDIAYPGPGYSQVAVTRAAKRGRQVTATIVADWAVKADQAVTITPYLTAAESGKVQTVTWTWPEAEMTVTTRDD